MGLSSKLASVEQGLLEYASNRPLKHRTGESKSQKTVRAPTTRLAKVKAAGGKKGLVDKLRKYRSPTSKDRAPLREINRRITICGEE